MVNSKQDPIVFGETISCRSERQHSKKEQTFWPTQYKNTTLIKFKMKRARFDKNAILLVFGFVPIDKLTLSASYKVAYLIAQQRKPHMNNEKLIKPAMLEMAINYHA